MANKYFPQNIMVNDALALQEQLAEELVFEDRIPVNMDRIGGAVMYCRGNSVTVSVVVLGFPDLVVKKKEIITEKMKFAAIPSCEGFREGKVLADAIKSLDMPPVYMIDGQGINHPRGLGIAAHVGLALGISTIGASRKLTFGQIENRDGTEYVVENDEIRAQIVKQKMGSAPIYVSPGNKITLETAVSITKKCFSASQIPEPIRIAQEALQEEVLKGVKI
ncbi:MAG: endonuclease V [archaeon]